MKKLLLTLTTLSLFAVANENIKQHNIKYPDGYRSWTHLKTSIIKQNEIKEFIGISHIYANDKAMTGLKLNSYEKGAIFILDHLDMNISKASIKEGKRFFTGVMIYNPKRFGKTGNWGFESFVGDSKIKRGVKNSINDCFNCHTQVKNKSYVFSSFRK
jgi:hypothetical protein